MNGPAKCPGGDRIGVPDLGEAGQKPFLARVSREGR